MDVLRRLRWGLGYAAAFGLAYCAIGVAIVIASGSRAFERLSVSLGATLGICLGEPVSPRAA